MTTTTTNAKIGIPQSLSRYKMHILVLFFRRSPRKSINFSISVMRTATTVDRGGVVLSDAERKGSAATGLLSIRMSADQACGVWLHCLNINSFYVLFNHLYWLESWVSIQ